MTTTKTNILILKAFLLLLVSTQDVIAEPFKWPNNAKAAVSLAYNDGLATHLDNAIPTLNRLNLKATFYPTIGSPIFQKRLEEWRKVASMGHELGNHSLYHPCDSSKSNRSWVPKYRDLNQYALQEMVDELAVANTFLQALDAKRERTYTYPCAEYKIQGISIQMAVEPMFVAAKLHNDGQIPYSMSEVDIKAIHYWDPAKVSGKELIEYVKLAAKNGTMAHISFHGIGGDFLSVSKKAHDELLNYLAANQDIYWTDTFIDIAKYIHTTQTQISKKTGEKI